MALFTSKVDYALRALLDLAGRPTGRPAQSREIASRQEIPESYLNQLLVVLRRRGLVRSVRGAAGGYVLGRDPAQVSVADVVAALQGEDYLGEPRHESHSAPSGQVIRNLHLRLNVAIRHELQSTRLADLIDESRRLDEAQSLMLGL